jgi:predicted alpha/beta-fold hydrolase
VLWRTCDGESVNAVRRSYHSGASDDAEVALTRIIGADPDRPTLLHGVSLGGNVLLKWLGERGDTVPASIRGAVAVSVPFDLAAASARIDRGWSKVYERFFLKTLKAKTAAKLSRYPEMIDAAALAKIRTLWEFDELVTGPVHGFSGAAEYYARSSSIHFLDRVRVPTLLLSARNDPFLPASVLEQVVGIARNNWCLTCCFPQAGGHVGFISGTSPMTAEYWMERVTMNWLENAAT